MHTLSQDELMRITYSSLKTWVAEEMEENQGSSITKEQRKSETIEQFMVELREYLELKAF